MQIFIVFVFGAIMLGSGVLLSPIWDTREPRIGLMATFSLALVVGGTVFYAEAFGWDVLVIDYMLFALITFGILGGTLSQAQVRAENRGEILQDDAQGWTGAKDIVFFALVLLLFLMVTRAIHIPLDSDTQATAYTTLTTLLGQSFETLAPFQPSVQVLFPPSFPALTAYLSQQLNQPIPLIQMSISAVISLLGVWVVYDFGGELRSKRLGRVMALIALVGIFSLFLRSQYVILMGFAFLVAFLTYFLRYLRKQQWIDFIASGLMAGAVIITDTTTTILLIIAYVLSLFLLYFSPANWRESLLITSFPSIKIIGVMAIPLIGMIAISPWFVNNFSLLTDYGIEVYQSQSSALILVIILLVGIFWGGWIGLRLWQELIPRELRQQLHRTFYVIAFFMSGIILLLSNTIIPHLSNNSTSTTMADVEAMLWLQENSDANAKILNHPDARWIAIYSQREAIFYPIASFFITSENANCADKSTCSNFLTENPELLTIWHNPETDELQELLQEYGINYIIIPQLLLDSDFQEQKTYLQALSMATPIPMWDDELYLELVFENGAKIYQVRTRPPATE